MEGFEDNQREERVFQGRKGALTVINLTPTLPDAVRSERQKTAAGELFLVFDRYFPVRQDHP